MSSTGYFNIERAIESWFTANFSAPAAIAYENTEFDASGRTFWVALMVNIEEVVRTNLSSNRSRGQTYNGNVTVQIFYEQHTDTGPLATLAGEVYDLFNERRLSTVDPSTTVVMGQPELDKIGATEDGPWHQWNVIVDFTVCNSGGL